MLRSAVITAIVFAAGVSAASVDDSKVTAQFAPSLRIEPTSPPDAGLDGFRCDIVLCPFQPPEELWKRDYARKIETEYMNEGAVTADRVRRREFDARYAETPPLEVRIGKSSCFGTLHLMGVIAGLSDAPVMNLLRCGF